MTIFLLPNKFKRIGWCLLIPATLLGIALIMADYEISWLYTKVFALVNGPLLGKVEFFSFITDNIANEIVSILFIIGALCVGFSKEKVEDEFVTKLRLSSLLWAVYINYLLLLLSLLFIYGTTFLTVMLYNIFTILIIFIIKFNYSLYKSSKLDDNEK